MPLSLYNKKRNFKETSEPYGKVKKSVSQLSFVIQRHKASRLHYDFRLQLDGVLKSWAVPKGPSLNPGDKRLAMMVEDHPYDYKDFSGIIPEGNYGAGIVEIWDEGTYADIKNSDIKTAEKKLRAGLKSGDLKFQLFGKKVKGEFALVKLKSKEDNSWLLIKHRDKFAIDTEYNSEAQTLKNSPINKWLKENKKEPAKKKIQSGSLDKSANISEKYEEVKKGDKLFTFGKSKVKVTHPGKIYFPEDDITKEDVVNYYISMSDYILPYLKGRPESLLRNPNGINDHGFFHKDAAGNVPSFVKNNKLFSESADKDIDYIICDNQATLTYMNNLGCIEINPWHSTIKALDKPDYLIIDIDPSEKNTFDQVVTAANVVKEVLDKAGAMSFCKTSGSTGLHIYVPTGKKYTYDQVKDFAYIICIMASEQLKDFTTLERNLQKRGNKHIYMDYLQNRKGQTIASAYSLRPKKGGTVSAPLEWKEVKSGLSPQQFTIHNILQRVNKKGDLFEGVLGKGINLNNCLKKLGA